MREIIVRAGENITEWKRMTSLSKNGPHMSGLMQVSDRPEQAFGEPVGGQGAWPKPPRTEGENANFRPLGKFTLWAQSSADYFPVRQNMGKYFLSIYIQL